MMISPQAVKRSKIEKSAIVMLALGEESAAEVIKHMSTEEMQTLSAAMANLQKVTRSDVMQALEEFKDDADQFLAVNFGSNEYIRQVLEKAIGTDRADDIMDDILQASSDSAGIDGLNILEPSSIVELIATEHPQIIATILVHLDRDKASSVLALLSERLRGDVMVRIATFGGVQPSALHDLTDTFNAVLSGQGARRSKLGGIRAAAEILNHMNTANEEVVMENLRTHDKDLASKIEDEMFVFDNLVDVDNEGIRQILVEIDTNSLPVALKGADETLVAHILANMSARAAEMLRDDIVDQGPVRSSVIETERKKILAVARRLADSGKITLGNKGDDEYV